MVPSSRKVLDRRLDELERRVDVLARTFSDPDLRRRLDTLRRSLAAAAITLQRATPTQCVSVASLLDEAEKNLSDLVAGFRAAPPRGGP